MTATKITVQTSVLGNSDKVWECYTHPKHIVGWNFASPDWQCPSAHNDLQVGGKYIARMEAKDGSFGFDFWAVYDEVISNKKLAYTMGDGRQAIVNFDDIQNNTTMVTITFDAENIHPIDLQKTGWQAILNNFKQYVESI